MKHLLLFILLIPGFIVAQKLPSNAQIASLNNFFEGYNKQNYSIMRKPLSGIMKLALSKNNLQKLYGTQYLIFGKAKITNLKSISEKQISFDVVYEKDTTESQRMGFAFNKKGKIMGLSNKSTKFRYPKTSELEKFSESTIKFKIDSMLQLKYSAGVFNGCVMVIDNGKIIYKNCAGFSNYENKTLLNDSSMFELASCSKQFTSIAILMLAEQGKLNYTDNIQKYIPDLPYQNITIENLLTHTSGLPDYEEMLDKYWDKKKFATNYDIVEYFKKYKPKILFSPGKKFEYSNTGYALLSIIIEKSSGLSYSKFLSENIFVPLGMKNTRVYNTRRSNNETINNYAYGYVYSDSLKTYLIPDKLPEYNYVIYMDAITGDGTVNSSISDLALWEKALRENKLVSKKTLDKAFTEAKLLSGESIGYGNGWELQLDEKWENIAYHSGSWPGYITFTLHFIDKDKSIIILSNNEYINTMKFANKIALLITTTN